MNKLVTGWYSDRARAGRDASCAGGTTAARCSCSRARGATPRRSSASTSSERARELIDDRSGEAVLGRQRQRAGDARPRGRCRATGVDPSAVLRVRPPRVGARGPRRLLLRRRRDARRRLVDRGVQRRRVRVPAPRPVPRRHRHERNVRPAPVLRRAGGRPLRRHRADRVRAAAGRARTWSVLRRRFVVLASGEGANEDIGESWRMAAVLGGAGVPNRVDSLGAASGPTTGRCGGRCCPRYLDELVDG